MTPRSPSEYTVFDRQVRSSIRLPSLRAPGDRDAAGPEIRVDRGSVPGDPADLPDAAGRVRVDPDGEFTIHETTDPDTLYWFYDGVGSLRVRDGRAVALSPAPDSTVEARRAFVRGPGLRSALVQQGDVVLHASAVVVDGRAVAFAGPSGRGKSTTAGALVAAGHDLLTDDVLPCDPSRGPPETAVVPPGAPSLSLDAGATRTLGVGRSVGDSFQADACPLTAVYLLTDGADLDIERLSPSRAVFALLEASYAIYRATDGPAQQAHIDACGTLGAAVDVCRLTRPRSLDALDALVDAVEADVADAERGRGDRSLTR